MALEMKKQGILLALGYLATLGGAGGFGYFTYEKYKESRDEEASVKKQIEMAEIKIQRIPGLETDVICLRENVGELVKILPDSKEVNEFVNKLNDFSIDSGVALSSLKPEKDTSKKKDVFDKVIYKLEMTANLDRFLQFLSACEGWERFVRVTSLEIDGGDWDEEMARDEVVHDISVALETYAYRGHDDPSKLSTTIHNYDRRRDSLWDEIISRRSEIRVERYTYVPNELRRDPFIDPRRRVVDEGDGGLPYEEQQALVLDFVLRASELAEKLAALEAPGLNFIRRMELDNEIDSKLYALQNEVETCIAARDVTDHSLRRRIERDVMPILRSVDESRGATAAVKLDDLREFRNKMVELLDAGSYAAAVAKFKTIEGRIATAELDPEMLALLQDIERSALQAEAALEFESKDIEIGGAIVASTRSVVVVNGLVLSEGDALEDDLIVHRIAADRIEFEYRGVVLAKVR